MAHPMTYDYTTNLSLDVKGCLMARKAICCAVNNGSGTYNLSLLLI